MFIDSKSVIMSNMKEVRKFRSISFKHKVLFFLYRYMSGMLWKIL